MLFHILCHAYFPIEDLKLAKKMASLIGKFPLGTSLTTIGKMKLFSARGRDKKWQYKDVVCQLSYAYGKCINDFRMSEVGPLQHKSVFTQHQHVSKFDPNAY